MDFISQLEYLEGHLKKLVTATKNLSITAQAKRQSMGSLCNTFQEWGKTETEFGNASKFEYPNKSSGEMVKVLNNSATTLEGWGKVLSFEPTIIESVVYAGVTYLNQQVDAFKNLIKLRDASIRDLEKADKSLAGKKAERESTGNGDKPLSGGVFSFSNKSETLNEAIAREEQDVRAKRRTVEAMARALFFSEIDRFNQDRQETMESAMACLAASELMVSTKNAKLFAAFFTSMKLDSGEWSTKAKDVLSLQVSCLPKPYRCTSSCSVQTHQSKRTDPQILKTTKLFPYPSLFALLVIRTKWTCSSRTPEAFRGARGA